MQSTRNGERSIIMLALLQTMFYSSFMVVAVVALLLPLLGMAAVTVIYILCDLFGRFRT